MKSPKRSGRGAGATALTPGKKRTASSRRWLQRQLDDPYVADAKRKGYRSRAAFKLAEIDDGFHLLRPGRRVVDLGAAPGGWTQVAAERVRPKETGGAVLAVDTADMAAPAGARFLSLDVSEADAGARVAEALGGPADVVLSDMAPASTGHKSTDHLRIVALAEAALDVAEAILAPGGAFVVKVWQGGATPDLMARIRERLSRVKHVKPAASRADSAEIYLVATGFRGANSDEELRGQLT